MDLLLSLEGKNRQFVLMKGSGVEQGLKLPFENSCFDFLIAFSILLEWR